MAYVVSLLAFFAAVSFGLNNPFQWSVLSLQTIFETVSTTLFYVCALNAPWFLIGAFYAGIRAVSGDVELDEADNIWMWFCAQIFLIYALMKAGFSLGILCLGLPVLPFADWSSQGVLYRVIFSEVLLAPMIGLALYIICHKRQNHPRVVSGTQ